jgi:hypothetical protein
MESEVKYEHRRPGLGGWFIEEDIFPAERPPPITHKGSIRVCHKDSWVGCSKASERRVVCNAGQRSAGNLNAEHPQSLKVRHGEDERGPLFIQD